MAIYSIQVQQVDIRQGCNTLIVSREMAGMTWTTYIRNLTGTAPLMADSAELLPNYRPRSLMAVEGLPAGRV